MVFGTFEAGWTVLAELLSVLVIPVMLLVFATLFLSGHPKHRNRWFGYRTGRSLKSEESWRLAHEYCGWYFLVTALVQLIGVAGVLLLGSGWIFEGSGSSIVMLVEVLMFLPVIPLTEKRLKDAQQEG